MIDQKGDQPIPKVLSLYDTFIKEIMWRKAPDWIFVNQVGIYYL